MYFTEEQIKELNERLSGKVIARVEKIQDAINFITTDNLPTEIKTVNHDWVRDLVSACTSGNSHGNYIADQVLCHRMAFMINKHFGLEHREWNVDGDPERDPDFKDPYVKENYFAEVKSHYEEKNMKVSEGD